MSSGEQPIRNASEAKRRLAVVPDSQCDCTRCQSMCARRPCWTTPNEARALIDAGLGDRLMRDWWVGNPLKDRDLSKDTSLLVPAMQGYEGRDCPEGTWFVGPEGACTFFTAEGRCELHARGLKPSEGRKAIHNGGPETGENVHHLCAASWATPASQRLVDEWASKQSSGIPR